MACVECRRDAFLATYKTMGPEAAIAALKTVCITSVRKPTCFLQIRLQTVSKLQKAPDSSPAAASAAPGVAFLFPGQGSQAVGMLQKAKDLPAVNEMLQKAQQILGFDLLEVCLSGVCCRFFSVGSLLSLPAPKPGPKEKLEKTEIAQPALFVAGLAAVEVLRASGPDGAAEIARCATTRRFSCIFPR